MAKVALWGEEWWPVVEISAYTEPEYQSGYEVPDALIERYKAALVEWIAVQKELAAINGTTFRWDDIEMP